MSWYIAMVPTRKNNNKIVNKPHEELKTKCNQNLENQIKDKRECKILFEQHFRTEEAYC